MDCRCCIVVSHLYRDEGLEVLSYRREGMLTRSRVDVPWLPIEMSGRIPECVYVFYEMSLIKDA